jgi:hypothetical protein
MIDVLRGEAFESPDQDTIYPLLSGQFTGRISGKNGNFMLASHPLAYVTHVLLYPTDSGEVSGGHL